jgi:hypothetical protein
MPIQVKNKLLQVRVDQALFDAFVAVADSCDVSVSGLVRALMMRHVDELAKREAREAQKAATLLSRAVHAPAIPAPVETPSSPLKTRPNDKKQRRLERKQGR